MIEHPIPPIYDEKSKILMLGSFPSVKSFLLRNRIAVWSVERLTEAWSCIREEI